MGLRGSKIGPLPIPLLIKRLGEAQLPDDRNIALENLEDIDKQLLVKKTFAYNCKLLKDHEAIFLFIRVTKKLIEDIEIVSVFAQMLETIKLEVPLMMDFIQFGGLDLLDKSIKLHVKDDFLAVMLPKLKRVILAVGAAVSIQEIDNEGLNLQICKTCQETIARNKSKLGSAAHIVIPDSYSRVNRVLKFMDNYLDREDVQVASLDAVLNFARNADAPTTARKTDVVIVVVQAMKTHKNSKGILWRACMAFSILSSFDSEMAVDILSTEIHLQLIEDYSNYSIEPILQQEILWMFASFLKWPRSKRVIHKEKRCMDFLYNLVQNRDNPPETKEDEEPIIIDYRISIPIQIRQFMRETKGKTYKEMQAMQREIAKSAKKRRIFDEKPRFGTVDTKIYVKGEDGLVPGENEDEFGEKMRETPDWEERLNFGDLKK